MKVPTEALCCPICYNEYNSTQNIPMVIPGCGHTICSKCLTKILEDPNSPKCPLDNRRFSIHQVGIESFPVNFIVKQLFDKAPPKTLCEIHNEKLRLICLTDKCRVCDACAFSGNHKGHHIKPIKKIEQEVTQKRKELENIVDEFGGSHENLKLLLEEKRSVLLEYIKSKFQEMRWILIKKELELLSEVNAYLDHEKTGIEKNKSIDSRYTNKIEEIKELLNEGDDQLFRILDYSNKFIEDKTLTAFLEEQAQQLNLRVDSQAIFLDNQMINQVESLDLIHFWSEKKPPKTDWNNEFVKIQEKEDWLVISLGGENHHDFTFSSDWKTYKKVILRVENNDEQMMNKCLQNLIPIWKNFEDLSQLKLEVLNKEICDKELLGLFSIVFENNHINLEELAIDLSDCKVGDQSLGPFISEIFPVMTGLKSVSLNLNFTNISDAFLRIFAREIAPIAGNLEHLDLRLWGTKITDTGVSKLFTLMENLKSLTVDLGSTDISDKGLVDLANLTLPSLKQLEELKINLSRTNITDEVMKQLSLNVKKLQVFMLNLHNTNITNQTIEALTKNIFSKFDKISSFDLRLGETKVTDEGIIQLYKNLKNVEHFMLKLQNTVITDKSIDNLFKIFLPAMLNLKEWDVDVAGTKVSRKCANQLSKIKERLSEISGDAGCGKP